MGISPFTQFVIESRGKLVGLPIVQRGHALGKAFKALSLMERSALNQRAKANVLVVKKVPRWARARGRQMHIPVKAIKKYWRSTMPAKGKHHVPIEKRLVTIARRLRITPRLARTKYATSEQITYDQFKAMLLKRRQVEQQRRQLAGTGNKQVQA